jgi:hypothetical protein
MLNRLTIFVTSSIMVITFLFLFSVIIQQPLQHYNVYAQIPGIPGSDNSNNDPSENTASESTTNNTAASSANFIPYHSDKSGYTLQYPSDWSVHEYETLNSVVNVSQQSVAASMDWSKLFTTLTTFCLNISSPLIGPAAPITI